MNSINKEDIMIPDYESLMNCIYDKFLWDAGQEFDYETYDKVLDKIGHIAGHLSSDYKELEDFVTIGFQDSARHGFLMGARLTMVLLFGWQQDPGMQDIKKFLAAGKKMSGRQQDSGNSADELKVMEFMKGKNHNG